MDRFLVDFVQDSISLTVFDAVDDDQLLPSGRSASTISKEMVEVQEGGANNWPPSFPDRNQKNWIHAFQTG
jgi:hypothetical protein